MEKLFIRVFLIFTSSSSPGDLIFVDTVLMDVSIMSGLQAAEEMVTAAYESGINYFDTGDGFVGGRSESVLGSILRRKAWRRNTYIVSTKLFWTSGPSVSNTSHPSLSRKFMIEALENSLKRLQLKYVDIVIINKLDGMCPMEEVNITSF